MPRIVEPVDQLADLGTCQRNTGRCPYRATGYTVQYWGVIATCVSCHYFLTQGDPSDPPHLPTKPAPSERLSDPVA